MGKGYLDQYPMCQDQPAQIDCRVEACVYYCGSGQCSNVSPAITLNPGGGYVCWSETTLEDLDIARLDLARQAINAEEETMKVIAASEYTVMQVTTDEHEWSDYRRYHADAWEQCVGGDWCEIDGELLEAAYRKFMQEDRTERALHVERDTSQRPAYKCALCYRRRAGVWEGKIAGITSWSPIDDPAVIAELEHARPKPEPKQDEEAQAGPAPKEVMDFDNLVAEYDVVLSWMSCWARMLYPHWHWATCSDPRDFSSGFGCDQVAIKARQVHCQAGRIIGKRGIIMTIWPEGLCRLKSQAPRERVSMLRQNLHNMLQRARVVLEGEPYAGYDWQGKDELELAAGR